MVPRPAQATSWRVRRPARHPRDCHGCRVLKVLLRDPVSATHYRLKCPLRLSKTCKNNWNQSIYNRPLNFLCGEYIWLSPSKIMNNCASSVSCLRQMLKGHYVLSNWNSISKVTQNHTSCFSPPARWGSLDFIPWAPMEPDRKRRMQLGTPGPVRVDLTYMPIKQTLWPHTRQFCGQMTRLYVGWASARSKDKYIHFFK